MMHMTTSGSLGALSGAERPETATPNSPAVSAQPGQGCLALKAALGWPKAGITPALAAQAFELAAKPLRVSTSAPAYILTTDGDCVGLSVERNTGDLDASERLAEMWARSRVMAQAPRMLEALLRLNSIEIGQGPQAGEQLKALQLQASQIVADVFGITPDTKAPSALG